MLSRRHFLGATSALLGCRSSSVAQVRAPDAQVDGRPVIGLEASFGELRHLKHVLGASVAYATSTLGWDHLEETEWPFFAVVFHADAATCFASLPRLAKGRREALHDEARWALASAHALGIKGANVLLPGGHLLLALEKFARSSGSDEHRELRDRLAEGLVSTFERSTTGIPPTYPTVSWTLDAVPRSVRGPAAFAGSACTRP